MIYKDIMAPGVLIGIPWMAALVLLTLSDFNYYKNSLYFMFFAIGIMVFNFGFIVSKIIISSKSKGKKLKGNYHIKTNNSAIKTVIKLELLCVLIYVIYLFMYVKSNYTFNFYYTLKLGESEGSLGYLEIIAYLNIFITAFTSLVIYASVKSKEFINRKYIFIQILLGLASSFITLGRTSIILFIILNLTVYIITAKVKISSIVKYGLFSTIVGLFLFSLYNLAKYPYLLASKSALEVATETLSVYASGSLVTFQQWAHSNTDMLFGENIFRFWKAILSTIGFNIDVKSLTNPFISISQNFESNVYTIYYFYAMDFGLVFSLIMQFVFGIYHGITYRFKDSEKPFWIYLFSLSIYPLIMQFFQDQYFSLTSTWIQYFIYGLFLYKTKIFFVKSKVTESQVLKVGVNCHSASA